MTESEKALWADLFLKHWDGNPDKIKDLAGDIDAAYLEYKKRTRKLCGY
jgi:hypothetical protein